MSSEPITVYIRPSRGLRALNLRDLWIYRELIYFLVWRDLKVRYKQTLLGASWAILQPLITMLVFDFIFGRIGKVPTEGLPYPLFSFAGLLPWGLFSTALNQGSRSLVSNQNMITKIYFPRLVLPLAAILAGLVDFAIAFLILIGLMIYYGVTPAAAFWTLPFFILLALITALGVALWLSALNVRYRDVNHALPFLTQLWLFLTPIAYSSSLISERWRLIYALNPMAGVVNGFRWALFGVGEGPGIGLWMAVFVALGLLISGLFYFRAMERTFADLI